jgi:hypothetical protein
VTDMNTFALVMFILAVHAYIGTLVGTKFYAWRVRACSACADEHDRVIDGRTGRAAKCETWHAMAATLAGVFWFGALPGLLGHKTAVVTDSGLREQKKHAEEIVQARHDRMIAEQRLAENRAIEATLSDIQKERGRTW